LGLITIFKKTLAYLEKSVPKSKISLGIATYGWLWNTDTNKRIKSTGYDRVLELVVNKLYDKKGFDEARQSAWITYTDKTGVEPVHYKLWYQDVRSFKAAYSLAKSHKLRGISVWVIGMEDGAIWKNLK
jgi:spore germination protein YaaH